MDQRDQYAEQIRQAEDQAVAATAAGLQAQVAAVLSAALAAHAVATAASGAQALTGATTAVVRAALLRRVQQLAGHNPTVALTRAATLAYRAGAVTAGAPRPPRGGLPPRINAAISAATDRAAGLLHDATGQIRHLPLATPQDVTAAVATTGRAVNALEQATRWVVEAAAADGAQAVADAAGDGRVWVAERDACLTCLAYSGVVAPAGEPFPGGLTFGDRAYRTLPILNPPAHPHCRCRVKPWAGLEGPGPGLPEVLRREAQRAVLRGTADAYRPARLRAAQRLLDSGQQLLVPRSVRRVPELARGNPVARRRRG